MQKDQTVDLRTWNFSSAFLFCFQNGFVAIMKSNDTFPYIGLLNFLGFSTHIRILYLFVWWFAFFRFFHGAPSQESKKKTNLERNLNPMDSMAGLNIRRHRLRHRRLGKFQCFWLQTTVTSSFWNFLITSWIQK